MWGYYLRAALYYLLAVLKLKVPFFLRARRNLCQTC